MLTVRQLFPLLLHNADGPLSARALASAVNTDGLSLATLVRAVEVLPSAYFVQVRLPGIIQGKADLADLQAHWNDPVGVLSPGQWYQFSLWLKSYGASLQAIASDYRSAAIVGTNDALGQIQTTLLTGSNFVIAQDKVAGTGLTATGAIGLGTVLVSIASVPEPASPVLFFLGLSIMAGASAFSLVAGVGLLMQDDPDPNGPTSANDESVDQPGDYDFDPMDIATAVLLGTPADGQDPAELVANLALSANTGTGLDLGNGDDNGLGGIGGLGGGLGGLGV